MAQRYGPKASLPAFNAAVPESGAMAVASLLGGIEDDDDDGDGAVDAVRDGWLFGW